MESECRSHILQVDIRIMMCCAGVLMDVFVAVSCDNLCRFVLCSKSLNAALKYASFMFNGQLQICRPPPWTQGLILFALFHIFILTLYRTYSGHGAS